MNRWPSLSITYLDRRGEYSVRWFTFAGEVRRETSPPKSAA